METEKLMFEQTIQAPIEQVYRAFTSSTALREWIADSATSHPHVGGNIYMAWNNGYFTSGEFLNLTTNQDVVFSWMGRTDPGPTRVTVFMTGDAGATKLKLEHTGLGNGEDWANARKRFSKGWEIALENLAHTLELGPDLRITTRPMMGINLDDFNEQIAKDIGVPVGQGVRIANALEGMGAHAAGLRKNDVIISLSGHDITDFDSLTSAMQGRKAGEKVEMTVYRGAEKLTFSMNLSQRPIPEIPPTAEGLLAAAKPIYNQIETELDAFLQDVTEEEASRKPGSHEWSIKGVLAHLIHSERGWQNFQGEIIGGSEAAYDDFGGNPAVRIDATVAAYATLENMRTELKRLYTESLAIIANLPEDFVSRKSSYWRLGYQTLLINYHFQDHLEQMKAVSGAIRT